MKIIGMEAGDTIEPRVTRYALWDDDHDQWRVSRTPPTKAEQFDDVGRDGEAMWLLTSGLSIIWDSSSKPGPASQHAVLAVNRPVARMYVRTVLSRVASLDATTLDPAADAAIPSARIAVLSADGDRRWSARLEPDGKDWYYELNGRWSDSPNERLIERITTLRRAGRERSGRDLLLGVTTLSDFRPVPGRSGSYPWMSQTENSRPVHNRSVTRLRSVTAVDGTEFAAVTRVPSISEPDAFRGEVKFNNLDDRRAAGGGTVQRLPQGTYVPIPSTQPPEPASGTSRAVGWIVLSGFGASIAALFAFRWFRARQTYV